MKIGIGGAEEDKEVVALKEALKKAHLLAKALRRLGTINKAEKEAL
jgi:hypothetical protein